MVETKLSSFDTWKETSATTHHALGACPCCDHPGRRQWFKNADVFFYRCLTCGVRYQDPQPDLAALLDRSYNKDYFASCQQQLPNQTEALLPRLAEVESLLTTSQPITALDVGSGMGAFMLAAAERGWQPVGLEPSPFAVRYCSESLGLNVIQGTLDDPVHFSSPFDVINLNHVLEHFQHPQPNVKRIRKLLRPGGILMVEVPRESKWASQLLHWLSSWRGATRLPRPTFTIVHMTIFTSASLRRLLEQCGFTVERLWVESNAVSPARFNERFGDSPPLGKLLGRAAQLFRADVRVGLGNIVALARRPL